MIPRTLLVEAEKARDTQNYEGDRYAFMTGVRWLFTRLCEMSSEGFKSPDWREKKFASMGFVLQGDHTRRERDEHIFEMGMRHQHTLSQAALLKAREEIARLKAGGTSEFLREINITYTIVKNELEAERAKCERLEMHLTALLESADCRGDEDCDHCAARQALGEAE